MVLTRTAPKGMSPFSGALNGLLHEVQKCPRSGSRESPAWTQATVMFERILAVPQVGQFTGRGIRGEREHDLRKGKIA